MNNKRYNQIIDETYKNYAWKTSMDVDGQFTKIEFINKCKTDDEFAKKWGLLIKETYDLIPHTEDFGDVTITKPKRRNKLIVVYNNETIEVYE